MKTQLIVFFLLILAVIGCSKKTVSTKEPAAASTAESPSMEVTQTSAIVDATALTAGKLIYETKCTRCHAAKPAGNFSAERWDGILKSMVPKAKLNEAETEQVTAYVKANAKR